MGTPAPASTGTGVGTARLAPRARLPQRDIVLRPRPTANVNSPQFVGQTWGSFMPQRIPQDVRQQVLQLLQKGLRYRAIARILHISCSTVKRWQGQFDHGIMDWTQARRPAVTSEIAQCIVQRYLEVGSFLQVAKEFGVSDRSVHRYYMNILNAGQPFLPKGRKPCHPKSGEPMPQQKPQRAQAASSRKARTTASYEKKSASSTYWWRVCLFLWSKTSKG